MEFHKGTSIEKQVDYLQQVRDGTRKTGHKGGDRWLQSLNVPYPQFKTHHIPTMLV